MASVTIQTKQIANFTLFNAAPNLIVRPRQAFLSSDREIYSTTTEIVVPCSLSSGTLTIPQFTLDSTTDSPDNPTATLAFFFRLNAEERDFESLNDAFIDHRRGALQTLDEIIIYNASGGRRGIFADVVTRAEMEAFVLSLIGTPVPPATTVVSGRGKLSVAAIDPDDPVLVGDNDPRMANARVPTGGAGGVLSGSYPNPGFAVDMATQAELDAHIAATNPHPGTASSATTITAGTGLTGGGNLSANRTISIDDTGVTPGSYTNANVTVNAQGQITAASNGSTSFNDEAAQDAVAAILTNTFSVDFQYSDSTPSITARVRRKTADLVAGSEGGLRETTDGLCVELGFTATTAAPGNILESLGSSAVFPIGCMIGYGGSSAPDGWLFCDGSVVSQSTYPALFGVIGTAYNIGGEGTGNFRLPDRRGRCSIGAGTGTGLTGRTLGQRIGTETVTLSTGNLPVFSLTLPADVLGRPSASGSAFPNTNTSTDRVRRTDSDRPYDLRWTSAGSANTSSIGSATPVSVIQPGLVENVIIKF